MYLDIYEILFIILSCLTVYVWVFSPVWFTKLKSSIPKSAKLKRKVSNAESSNDDYDVI